MKLEARTLHVSIHRGPDEVYRFLANPENLPQWAAGLGHSIRYGPDGWTAETPNGSVKVRFEAPNTLRVADHYVTPTNGAEVHIPIRVLAHGGRSEVIFTLFPQPGMSAEKFQEDARMVRQDLDSLKRVLESPRN
jgi:hypothetical protein